MSVQQANHTQPKSFPARQQAATASWEARADSRQVAVPPGFRCRQPAGAHLVALGLVAEGLGRPHLDFKG